MAFLIMVIPLIFSGCVTFNDIDRPVLAREEEICAKLTIFVIRKSSLFNDKLTEEEPDYVSKQKLLRVLSSLHINTNCDKDSLNLIVKIHPKTSRAYVGLIGAWSVLTIVSAGLIPTYSSFDTDIEVTEVGQQTLKSTYSYSSAVWLPFVVKQFKDDSYAMENYNLPAKPSVMGIEIAKLIHNLVSAKKEKPASTH